MQRFFKLLLPMFFGLFLLMGMANAQVFRLPTPTPSPRASPSPTPTPEVRPVACPNVTIQPQGNQMVRDGQPIAFALNIAGGDPRVQPQILWSLSAGAVKAGQYTRRVEVDTTGAGAGSDRAIKAEVWVGGYAPECVIQASASIKIIPPAAKFGELGDMTPDAMKFHMNRMAEVLGQSPDNLYVIGYAGRKNPRGYAASALRQLKEILTMNGIEAKRIIAVDGGFRDDPLFDFWTVPNGADPPRPTPTVRREEIVFPPTTPVKKP